MRTIVRASIVALSLACCASAFAQPECAIKGNISSSGERIYHDRRASGRDVPEPDARMRSVAKRIRPMRYLPSSTE